MIKKVFGIIAITSLLFSCGNKEQKKESAQENKVATLSVEQLVTDIQSYVEKEIAVEGTVNHICEHGGKRMFIMGKDPDVSIKVTPNDEIGAFEKELEGSSIFITGIIKELRIDEAYVANMEKELNEGSDNEAIHDHSGGEHADEEAEAKEKNARNTQIVAMRAKIAESENGYYSIFSIEANKFEATEGVHSHEHIEGEKHEHEHEESEDHTH